MIASIGKRKSACRHKYDSGVWHKEHELLTHDRDWYLGKGSPGSLHAAQTRVTLCKACSETAVKIRRLPSHWEYAWQPSIQVQGTEIDKTN